MSNLFIRTDKDIPSGWELSIINLSGMNIKIERSEDGYHVTLTEDLTGDGDPEIAEQLIRERFERRGFEVTIESVTQ